MLSAASAQYCRREAVRASLAIIQSSKLGGLCALGPPDLYRNRPWKAAADTLWIRRWLLPQIVLAGTS